MYMYIACIYCIYITNVISNSGGRGKEFKVLVHVSMHTVIMSYECARVIEVCTLTSGSRVAIILVNVVRLVTP